MKTEYFSDNEVLAFSLRGWRNLDNIAKVLVENTATNPATAMSVSETARRAGMDVGQLSRLIKDKPGIVRVMREGSIGYGIVRPRTIGLYYLPEMAALVKELGTGDYYPTQYGTVGRYILRHGPIPKSVTTDEPVAAKPTKVEADLNLTSLLSGPAEAYVTVPFLKQKSGTALKAVDEWIMGPLLDGFENYKPDALPLEDLKALRDAYGLSAIRATSIYALINEIIENKELK